MSPSTSEKLLKIKSSSDRVTVCDQSFLTALFHRFVWFSFRNFATKLFCQNYVQFCQGYLLLCQILPIEMWCWFRIPVMLMAACFPLWTELEKIVIFNSLIYYCTNNHMRGLGVVGDMVTVFFIRSVVKWPYLPLHTTHALECWYSKGYCEDILPYQKSGGLIVCRRSFNSTGRLTTHYFYSLFRKGKHEF